MAVWSGGESSWGRGKMPYQPVNGPPRPVSANLRHSIEKAHTEAQEVVHEAEKLQVETQSECLKMAEVAHEERRKISRFMKRVRDVVVRIGSALGLDLLGKGLMRDLASIEEDLVTAENPAPEADRNDGPERRAGGLMRAVLPAPSMRLDPPPGR